MSEPLKRAVRAAVLRLLYPLVKLLLEAGVGVGDLMALVKVAYVRAAREQGRQSGGEQRRPNASRIAVVTGLTRAEVAEILPSVDDEPTDSDRPRQRAERVLSGWWNDPDFQDDTGAPAVLPLQGARRSFEALCERYSGERGRTSPVLSELLRVRAARRLKDGTIEALSRTYATVRWDPDGIAALGDQLSEHCTTLVHNLKHPGRPLFSGRVLNARLKPFYRRVLVRDLEQQAETLIEKADDALNDPQHTVKPSAEPDGSMRLGLCVYLFEAGEADERGEADAPEKTQRRMPRARKK